MTKSAWAFMLIVLFAACAQVKEPQGGPKDTEPPKLISAEPADGSIQFSGKKIVLHFNERVKLDRVRERLLISPPLAKAPDVMVSGSKDVVITLNAPLKASTTYTFNIGEAVQDLSEGNPAEGLSYVVSTGNNVDSLSVTGVVLDGFSGQSVTDALVLLHDERDTGDVRTASPAYFTRTDANGNFKLANLRGGPMYLNALRDRNGNYRYDLPSEDIAFADSVVDPAHAAEQTLFLFQPLSAIQFVVAAKVQPDRGWQLIMSRPAGEIALRSLDRSGGSLTWWPEWSKARDTVLLWPSDTTLLNGQRFIITEDGKELDTLGYRVTAPMPFNLVVTAMREPVSGALFLKSSRPVAAVDTAHVVFLMDTMRVPLLVTLDPEARRNIRIDRQLPAGGTVSLTLYPKAVEAAMGGTNDTTRLAFGRREPRTMGKLKVELTLDSGTTVQAPVVLQLRAGQDRVIREDRLDSLPSAVSWADLTPGTYSLKLIEDRDGNGRWSTGSLIPTRQAERVFLLKDPVVVRAGWSIETNWKVIGHH